jgi:hypothetical protein
MRATVSRVTDLTADETARRCRAAWAYAALDQSDLAARAGIHKDRFRRLIARSSPDRASIEEMRAIANITGVPDDFMEHGWDITRWQSPDTLAGELAGLRDTVHLLQQEIDADVGALQAAMIEVRQQLGMQWRPEARPAPLTRAERGH